MKLSLIICTYKRAQSLLRLLDSVEQQSRMPDEILIVDGSPDDETALALEHNNIRQLHYYKVKPEERGLTKQRNIGVDLCNENTDIVAFLDDDIVLDLDYFKNLLATYDEKPEAIAVGGYINNGVKWENNQSNSNQKLSLFCFDGYCRPESSRNKIRAKFGLAPDRSPAHLPKFSHGKSVGFLPPSGKIYEVEQFMGGVSSYKEHVFEKVRFSKYYEGYGLYEDADFCFRLMKYGKLYVNTAAYCEHHHHPSGRPNQFQYGQMVVRNGWYVWRLRWPNPGCKNIFKWHCTTLLLASLRFLNAFTTKEKKQALTESCGRFWAWLKLWVTKPGIEQ